RSTLSVTIGWLLVASFPAQAQTNSPQAGLSFNGVDDFLQILPAPLLGTNFTEEAWIYPQAPPRDRSFQGVLGYQPIVGVSGIGKRSPGLWIHGQMELHAAFGNEKYQVALTSPPHVVQLNAWNHVASTYDGAVFRLY